jgi:hypothetical protein
VSGLSKTTILERIKELHSRRANRRLLEHEIVISCLLSKNLSAGPFSVPSVFSVVKSSYHRGHGEHRGV